MKAVFLWVAVVVGACGCASEPLTLDPIGPSVPKASRFLEGGTLQVYSALTERNDSRIKYNYPQNYFVFTPERTLVKAVVNSQLLSEEPARVNLPGGKYLVKAPSDGFGWVYVPVSIKGGAITEVHLDRRWRLKDVANATNLVRLPDG